MGNVNIGILNYIVCFIGDIVDDILFKWCKMKDILNINVVKRKINVIDIYMYECFYLK